MRNTPLSQVLLMVKAETAKSLQSSSTAQDTEIYQIIADVQAWLAASYDWPFLKSRWDSTLTPAERYQTFPTVNNVNLTTQINLERPVLVMTKWNNIWQEVIYGIDEIPEFNYLDSDRAQVLDPAQRWQFSDELQYEIWPLPASTVDIRFVGQRALTSLYTSPTSYVWNPAATLDLDDLLVTFFVSTEYLTREENPKAQIEAQKAQRRLMVIRSAYPVRNETICIGRGQPMDRKAIRQVPLVLVGGR